MKGTHRRQSRLPQAPAGGSPALAHFRSPFGSPQVKPPLPLSQASFLRFGCIFDLNKFFFFFVIFARAFTMRFPFILKTVAFKPRLISDCFMFAGFWKVWSWSLGGQLPICSLLRVPAWKGWSLSTAASFFCSLGLSQC